MKRIFALLILVCIQTAFAQSFELSVQSGHTGNVTSLVFSTGSRFLLSSGTDKKTIVSDLTSNKQLLSVITETPCKEVIFAFHDSVVVTVEEGKIKAWNIASAAMEYEMQVQVKRVFEAPDQQLALVTDDKLIFLDRNYHETGRRKLSVPFTDVLLSGNKKELYCFHNVFNVGYAVPYAVSGDMPGPPNYTGSKRETKRMTELGTREMLLAHPSEKRICFVEKNGVVGNTIDEENKYWHFGSYVLMSSGWREGFRSAAISENYLFLGSKRGFIYTYNSKTGKQYKTLNLHTEPVNCIAISGDEKYFASSSTNEIVLWSMEEKKPIHFFRSMSQPLSCFTLSNDGKKIITGAANGEMKFWDMETNEIRTAEIPLSQAKRTRGHSAYITKVTYTNDSIIQLELVIGLRQSNMVGNAIVYKGVWHVFSNNIELNPVKEYKLGYYTIENLPLKEYAWQNENYSIHVDNTDLSWKDIVIKNAHKDIITCVRTDDKNKIIYTSSADGVIKMWDPETGMELLTLLSYKTNFLYKTPENYYYASKGGLKNVAFKNGLKLYPFEQFDLQFNRPEKIIVVQPFYTADQRQLFVNAYKKRLKRLGLNENSLADFTSAPYVSLEMPEQKTTRNRFFKLNFTAADTSGSNIVSAHLLINGSELYEKNFSEKKIESTFEIELSEGLNFIQVYVVNDKGISSVKEGITITETGKTEKDLYLIVIGSSQFKEEGHNLKYAAKDAKDIAAQFAKSKKYRKIITHNFIDKEVKAENIIQKINELKNVAVNDEVIVFYAGHGLLSSDLSYFLSTYEVNFENPQTGGLPYDSLIKAIESLPARDKIVFLDACHSGELDKDDVMKKETVDTPLDQGLVFRAVSGSVAYKENAVGLKNSLEVSKILFADLKANNGVCVVSSAGGAEYAMEGDQWNNGVFTYCLLKGIKNNEGDLNGDKKIYMDELQTYITREVKRVSGGLQSPTSRSENIYHNIRIK